ncbi:MAG: hypothetical protein ACI8X5_000490 [Planctomycetota bacterium]|jgi:hypothetical protein
MRIWAGLIACLALTVSANAQGGGIEILAGETLFSRGTRVSIAHLYEQKTNLYSGSKQIDNPKDLEASRQRVILGYNFGVTARFDVGALLPFVDPEVQSNDGTMGESGVGDASIYGKYRLYTRDASQNSLNVSVLAGVETPTGQTGSEVPQAGTGSWDPFLGLAVTDSRGRFRFDGHMVYKLNTEGSLDISKGDEWSIGLSAAYRYLHRPYPGPSHSAKLGILWQGQTQAARAGNTLPNSGTERLLLRPALGFHPIPAIDISLNVDIPLYQHYDGQQLGFDFRTFFALGYRF